MTPLAHCPICQRAMHDGDCARDDCPYGENMAKWLPIDTAPRDGTRILAAAKRDGRWHYAVTWWRQPSDTRSYIGWGEFNDQHWPALYWQPIEPPA